MTLRRGRAQPDGKHGHVVDYRHIVHSLDDDSYYTSCVEVWSKRLGIGCIPLRRKPFLRPRLAASWGHTLNFAGYFALSLCLALSAGVCSWHLVEKWFLRRVTGARLPHASGGVVYPLRQPRT
jgi:hypothetical protein